jgi:carboxypeptidase D
MLLTQYDNGNPRIVDIVDSTAIWIVPAMNPDGLEADSRFNADGYDLNRSFPSYPDDFTDTIFDGEPLGDANRPVETAHIMRWSAENSFILGGEFHTGALVMNYPYDDDGLGSVDSPTPDDLLFEDISRRYSIHNPPMWNSTEFYQGISNGAAWYSISGGMEDWCYRYLSCNDVIIEISDDRQPPSLQIPDYWEDNRESMLAYLEAVHIGVRGVVTDSATSEPVYAKITVADNAHPVFTDPDVGDYHRMLLPGQYDLTFSAPGYVPQTVTGVTVGEGVATRIDVELVFNADLSGDNDIDFEDFALFAEKWHTDICPGCPGDYSGNGRVDAEDLVGLMSFWLADVE